MKRENRVQKEVGWRDKSLTETNDVLAGPDQTAQIHEKQKMDECQWGGFHERRELDFTEENKMDGCRPSHCGFSASGSAVGYLREVGEKGASMSHLTDNKKGGQACWKVGQEQAGLL